MLMSGWLEVVWIENQRYICCIWTGGGLDAPPRDIREHHENSAGCRKPNRAASGASRRGRSSQCVVCSRVLRQWPGSPSTKEGDSRDSRCRLMLRVFTVAWCVGNMLGPPARIRPALWERQGEKAHVRGSFSCCNLLCSFPFLRHFCLSTCTSLNAVGVRSPFSPM